MFELRTLVDQSEALRLVSELLSTDMPQIMIKGILELPLEKSMVNQVLRHHKKLLINSKKLTSSKLEANIDPMRSRV